MRSNKNRKHTFCVIIAGGGTGGHVYPGIAIAREIHNAYPTAKIHFVGTKDGLETKIVPKEGFELHLIQGGKLNFPGQWFKKILTLIKLPLGFFQSFRILSEYQPVAVLGVGGYASGPFLLMASLLGYPTAVWEGNAIPGMTNRILGHFVKQVFTVFDQTESHFQKKNVFALGLPLRPELEMAAQKNAVKEDKTFTVLHFGGSQGSRIIGTCLSETIRQYYSLDKNIQFIHQTGALDFDKFKAFYESKNISNVEVKEFIYDMPQYYKKADLVIARAGASTVAELSAFGIPTIFIPLPLADGHQEHNAKSLADSNGAISILQSQLSAEVLHQKIEEMRNNPELRKRYSEVMRRFHRPQAAKKIAESFINISLNLS